MLLDADHCGSNHLVFHLLITGTLEPIRNLTGLTSVSLRNNFIMGACSYLALPNVAVVQIARWKQ